MDIRANPFKDRGQWYWRDDHDVSHGPYPTQVDALRNLMRALDKRSGWEKFKELALEFLRS